MNPQCANDERLCFSAGTEKIQPIHRERLAIVYVRQSTLQQVERHQESTRMQYGLRGLAEKMGWPAERVLVVDDDLGMSGASGEGRQGFQRLLSEVALEHVGLILGVEMSRLSRSCPDWYQLLKLCAVFRTLICDLEGLYDPAQHNDRLLLGLKGTISEAELHLIKQRMLQGKYEKARRGELAIALPTGYVRDASGQAMLDPDERVQEVVKRVFGQFERCGSLHQVLKDLVEHDLRIGVRALGGPQNGQLEWRRPTRAMVHRILRHPIYAGAYVYGRTRVEERRKKPGRRHSGQVSVPQDAWRVCLRDRLPAYITWEDFERNQAQLRANRSRWEQPGVIRKGPALLQGLVVCGRCGKRMLTLTGGRSLPPRYACRRDRIDHAGPLCQSLAARGLDAEVSRVALEALEPSALEVSLEVQRDLAAERAAVDRQWEQRLEQARYETERARRQYDAVEPENRLVARTLESHWEENLRSLRALEEERARLVREQPREIGEGERGQILALAQDLPRLWHAPTTEDRERKEILRHLIERVVVTVEGKSEWVEAKIEWAGSHETHTRFRRDVRTYEQLSGYEELRSRVRELHAEGLGQSELAERLNQEGWRPAKRRRTFDDHSVRGLLGREGLRRKRPQDDRLLGPDEWWVSRLGRELGMSLSTLYSWVRKGWVRARQVGGPGGCWAVSADQAEIERMRARLRTEP